MSHEWVLFGALLAQSGADLSPQAEQASFTLPEGYRIECVVSEGIARKIVDIAFDAAGSMWAVTASEYPVDGNEDSGAAELYRRGGQDQVLVIERPWEGTYRTPRVFASGLAMPMTVLPLPEGVLIQHGSEILRLRDTDGDGRADARDVLLSGFGIEDSHLLPHRFLRAPDGWICMAQGAFNHSLVLDGSGMRTRFDQCKVGRFTRDGARFETLGVGLNNIWGMVFDQYGEFLVQEANDLGYGVVPFVFGASYPGIGEHRFRPWAPLQPPGTELRFGGTGLSGLAFTTSARSFPPPYAGAVFLANPIERRVQAVLPRGRGIEKRFELLPTLLQTEDPRFRPIAVHFGPDDSLYVVDWYNPIISHNEVPRTHPERDRVRTRVWRLRHENQQIFDIPDLRKADEASLLANLDSPRHFLARGSWYELVDRKARGLIPELRARALDPGRVATARLLALWTLEGLGAVDLDSALRLLQDPEPALRRSAIRGLAASGADAGTLLALAPSPALDPDTEARCEWLRALARTGANSGEYLLAVLSHVPPPDEREQILAEQGNLRTLQGASLAAMRTRMWIRIALENRGEALERWLDTEPAIDAEAQALAALSLGGADGTARLAVALATMARAPHEEELKLMVRHSDAPGALDCLRRELDDPSSAQATLEALLTEPPGRLAPVMQARIVAAARERADEALIVRLATALELSDLAVDLARIAGSRDAARTLRRDALRALARLRHDDAPLYVSIADACLPGEQLQLEALLALCASGSATALDSVLARLNDLPRAQAKRLLAQLAWNKPAALQLLQAAGTRLDPGWFDESLLRSIEEVLGDPRATRPLRALSGKAGRELLELGGGTQGAARSALTLTLPFTIEAWVQCHEGVDNREGILGRPGGFDFNFAGGRPRLYLGPQRGDVIIADETLEPERWTHVALTASAAGELRLYVNDRFREARIDDFGTHADLDIGRTTPGHGKLNLCEVRIWDRVRSTDELNRDRFRVLDGDRPSDLRVRFPGDVLALEGGARVVRSSDGPPLLDAVAHAARRARFAHFAALAEKGNAAEGASVFATLCQQCHVKNGVGASVGPPLDGIHNRGLEGMLTAILEPSAAVESGYRVLRVELVDETAVEGLLVRSEDQTVTIRPVSATGALDPQTIPRDQIARLRWSTLSVMPEGLLESLSPEDAANLLAYTVSGTIHK
jgi:putative membrane-bound dehydrogenase-like protein